MDTVTYKVEQLKAQISKTEEELRQLKTQLAELEASVRRPASAQGQPTEAPQEWKWPLKEEEYARYGRQLVLPSVGIKGQLRLKSTAVLVVGAGGLGSRTAPRGSARRRSTASSRTAGA
ncbi:hypothetical protein NUW58_g7966 [Xylaria curta]|uniref:Uncharacterized protein n=1 Tax=Xylaria curta TaxID=42375 RepID=A0ACC1ND84_9PEZI|nr:hypothetical protein NUW58_g7966 [Xylaria curta]